MEKVTIEQVDRFAEKNGWMAIRQSEEYICYLTPRGQVVIILVGEDGSIAAYNRYRD